MKISTLSRIVIISLGILVPMLVCAQAGTAIYFQNLDYMSHGDFIYCGQPDLGVTDEITVSMWIKWKADPGTFARTNHSEREGSYSTYMAYATHNTLNTTSEAGQFWLRNTKTGNKIEFTIQNTLGNKVTASSTTKPGSDVWYYITGTYDGSNVKLYINGTLEATSAQTGNIRSNTDCRLNMGRLPWGYGFFAGYMDEVRIWNIALSESEIQSQMNSSSTVQDANCKCYYNFNSGSGTTITDSKGLANGTFYTGLTDVHGGNVDLPNKIIDDPDRSFVTGAWNGLSLHTIAGSGVDETNIIVSNTGNVSTLTYGFAGSGDDNRTTPVLDGIENMTWFGMIDPAESSQWVSSSDISLPVTLSEFSAEVTGRQVSLHWVTESEINNLGFIIERRDAGAKTWSEIASYVTQPQLRGQGSKPGQTQYTYQDDSPSIGLNLYRIADVDYRGEKTWHPEVDVFVKSASVQTPTAFELVRIFPNPFNPSLSVEYRLVEQTHTRIFVCDLRGRIISTLVDGMQDPGTHHLAWAPGNMTTGIYLLQIHTGSQTQTAKVVYLK